MLLGKQSARRGPFLPSNCNMSTIASQSDYLRYLSDHSFDRRNVFAGIRSKFNTRSSYRIQASDRERLCRHLALLFFER